MTILEKLPFLEGGWEYRSYELAAIVERGHSRELTINQYGWALSFYQYAPPDVFTWEELLLIVDFIFATSLAGYSLWKKDKKDCDE